MAYESLAPAHDEEGYAITQDRWEKVLCKLELACTKARDVEKYAIQLEAALIHVIDTGQYPSAGCDACAKVEVLVADINAKRIKEAP